MEKKIHTGKILLITSLTVNLFLLLLLYVISRGSAGCLVFDKIKASSVLVHVIDRRITGHIQDNRFDGSELPSREHIYDSFREKLSAEAPSIEIIYSWQALTSLMGNEYNLFIFDTKTGIGKWSKIK